MRLKCSTGLDFLFEKSSHGSIPLLHHHFSTFEKFSKGKNSAKKDLGVYYGKIGGKRGHPLSVFIAKTVS